MSRENACLSYVIPYDCGFAPNPWGKELTLSCCKPVIRKTAKVGDWVIGLTPKKFGNKLVYAMIVDEVVPFDQYYTDPRFGLKKPDFSSDDIRLWMGDNIYELFGNEYIQHQSARNTTDRDPKVLEMKKKEDLSGKHTLISGQFVYFGGDSQSLPKELDFLKIGRGHRVSGSDSILLFEKHAAHLIKKSGIQGEPKTLVSEAEKIKYLHT